MTIRSNPPSAMVLVNNQEIGAAPVDVPSHQFIYYGNYDIKLVKSGFEPLLVKQPVPAPWYQRFGLDFFSENLIPWTIRDHRRFEYTMQPVRVVPPDALLQNAEAQRGRAQGIAPASAPPPFAGNPDPLQGGGSLPPTP